FSTRLLLLAKKFVELVGGLEFLIEIFAGKMGAQVVDGLCEAVECARNVVGVAEKDVPPDAVRAPCQTQRILQTVPRERKRQTCFVRFILHDARERYRDELRKVGD